MYSRTTTCSTILSQLSNPKERGTGFAARRVRASPALVQTGNAATRRLGDVARESDIDCAPGTCWEGICWGHKVYTTDGTCGYANGNRKCAGKQGTYCSIYGRCGRYDDFCGAGICQSGDCESQQPHLDVFLMSSQVCKP
ncbi:hypothetical protein GQ607_016070 [Colletotrichum asianum]|uniref:Chitin-binding type-1 domain-containing protein n=1 Tax=Colletotrichum asianum TaxID=702518 RepID=A0A8H3W1U3_9PEZI|nr:hypothetical protein GQ607_016070 [Colletotrichum asianum]